MLNLATARRFALALTFAVPLIAGDVGAQTTPEPCRGQGGTITEQTTLAMEVLLVTRADTPCHQVLNGIFGPRLARPPEHGAVVFEGTGLTYRPTPGFVGRDLFEFTFSTPLGTARFMVRVAVVR